MFQFHRILQYARPHPGSQQPFFWIFVDNLLLSEDDQVTAARFFQVGVSGARSLACTQLWDSTLLPWCVQGHKDIGHLRHRLQICRTLAPVGSALKGNSPSSYTTPVYVVTASQIHGLSYSHLSACTHDHIHSNQTH